MTNTETDLKPCQCGAGMLVDNNKPDLDPDWEALQAGVKFCASRDGDVCWIKCTKCHASTRPCNTEEQATKEWNDGKLLPPIASRFFVDLDVLMKSLNNLKLSYSENAGNPYVAFHPKFDENFGVSRVWHGNKEGYIDTKVTFRAIDEFNDALERITHLHATGRLKEGGE
jgi:hypothetical protein